jgi:chromosome segregation ATPase
MDLNEAIQMLKWLDEERRKDRAIIASLQERVQQQEKAIEQREASIQELQSSLTAVQSELTRIDRFEAMVDNFKGEILARIEDQEQTRRRQLAEAERLRRTEYEGLTDHVHRLERELRVLPGYDEELKARQAEESRLSEALQRLAVQVKEISQRSDDRVQSIIYLEEQRRADNRRIVELEQDTAALLKKIDALAKKIPFLEENIQKQRPLIEQAMREVKKYEQPIEELRASDFQREQKMKQYLDQGEMVAKEMERVRAQTEGFIAQQQQVKRAIDRLESFQGRIEKRQNEVSEMQRIAEDRLKRQWEEWQEERQKQFRKQTTVIEERWRRQEKVNDEYAERIKVFPPILELHQTQLDALWEVRQADATTMLKAAQDVYDAHIAPIDEYLTALREGEE